MTTINLPEWPWQPVRELARERSVRVWMVGGALRDLLLGREVHDWDFAVDRNAMALARAAGDTLGGFYFPLDEERGTARVVLATEGGPRLGLDFALLRGETLEADLAARDFTINAMAASDAHGLIDPLGGQADLKAELIRATQRSAFSDDPVRLVRALRLETELGFEIEAQTEELILQTAPLLAESTAERLRDEFSRGLAVAEASEFVRRLDELDLLLDILPELEPLKGLSQSFPHRFDVWRHTLRVVEAVEAVVATATKGAVCPAAGTLRDVPESAWGQLARMLGHFADPIRDHLTADVCDRRDGLLLLKLGALLHDIGKPQTCSVDDEGRVRFHGHESVGARAAASRMEALRFSHTEIRRVRQIVEAHLRPAHLARGERTTRRAIYHYFRGTGRVAVEAVLLSLADHLATWGPDLREERWARRLETAELLLYHFFEQPEQAVDPELPIDGHDLMRVLELEPGPEIGRLLDLLREAVAAGEVATEEEALEMARKSAEMTQSMADAP